MTDTIVFRPIGVVRSPFTRQEGTPIQPGLAAGTEGEIELDPGFAPALTDLDGFERIWVLYELDHAGAYRPQVVPYRDERSHGRSESRATPCGAR